jgi:hypothetical protein
MVESRGGQARTWSWGKGSRRTVSRGTAQRAMAAPALGGDGENGRWANWVGRKLGLLGCAGGNGEGKRWARMWAGASELCCKGGLRGGGRKRKKRERETGPGGENWPNRVGIPFFLFQILF